MRTMRQVVLPAIGVLVTLVALVGAYYWAKSGIPTPPTAVPRTPLPVPSRSKPTATLPTTRTPDSLSPLLTPPGSDRTDDGRYISTDGPFVIPDNSRQGAVSHIRVTGHFTVGTVQVLNIRVNHRDTGELVVRLLAPDLTLVPLLTQPCPGFHDWAALSLFDGAYKLLRDEGCGNDLNDTFRPDPGQALSAFNGAEAYGDWALSVVDTKPGNVGNFERWSILFTAPITSTPVILTPSVLPGTGTVPAAPATKGPEASPSPPPSPATASITSLSPVPAALPSATPVPPATATPRPAVPATPVPPPPATATPPPAAPTSVYYPLR